ncbi:MAG: alpha/beta fold hydrolase [Chloroflexi bacterium]|nr:alpha/beta fold hydrolase [Chloroflexota bacterium]
MASLTDSTRQIFSLGDFPLEGGVTLPDAKLAYVTIGTYRPERNTAILLPSWYAGDYQGYEFLIGEDKALNPDEHFLVLTEMFANGESSSPSNTPSPFNGPNFPRIAIRDNVTAAYRLLTEKLGVTHLKAVIGFSMGAQQAFQWAVSHPDFVDAIVASCGTAKTYPHGFARLESAISTFKADEAFQDGNYSAFPEKGFAAWSQHWKAWMFSQEWYRQELFKANYTGLDEMLQDHTDWQGSDANNLISQAITWQQHNVGTTPGFDGDHEKALASIQAQVLYLPGQTDLYFPIGDAEYERQFIRHLNFAPIPSIWGHTAGAGPNPEDAAFVNAEVRNFLTGLPKTR